MQIFRTAIAFISGVLLSFAAGASTARADVIYTYTGSPFTSLGDRGLVPGDGITVTLTFNNAFTLGESWNAAEDYNDPPLLAFTMTDGNFSTLNGAPLYYSAVDLGDFNGTGFDSWTVDIVTATDQFVTTSLCDALSGFCDLSQSIQDPDNYAESDTLGTWSVAYTSSTPEPTTFALVLVSLGAIVADPRKRRFILKVKP